MSAAELLCSASKTIPASGAMQLNLHVVTDSSLAANSMVSAKPQYKVQLLQEEDLQHDTTSYPYR